MSKSFFILKSIIENGVERGSIGSSDWADAAGEVFCRAEQFSFPFQSLRGLTQSKTRRRSGSGGICLKLSGFGWMGIEDEDDDEADCAGCEVAGLELQRLMKGNTDKLAFVRICARIFEGGIKIPNFK
jgi:hypothetical protein